MMSVPPSNTRPHLKLVIPRHRLNHPKYHMDNHHGNSCDDNRTESRRNQPLVNVPSEDRASPIVVDDDGTTGSTNIFGHDGEFSGPSCSRVDDSAGHPWNHIRRRRLESTDDVIVTDSPKRARVEVPVIGLTSDNDDNDYVTPGNDIERRLMWLGEPVQNSTRRLAELRARRREQMMSMLPDNTRRHPRPVISRHRSNHPNYHVDSHHGNSSDDKKKRKKKKKKKNRNRTESRRNQPLVDVPSRDGARPIVVDNALSNATERFRQVKPQGLAKADKQQPEHRDGTRTDTCHRDVHFDSRNRNRSSPKLVAGIPPMITRPEIRKVSTKEFKKVVFDLETTGFGEGAEICQIAATDGLDEFNVYVLPQHDISPGASKMNNLRIEGKVLFQGNCRVSAVHLNEAVSELLKWLESKTPCVLVAHNAKCFDAKHLFKAIVSCDASKEFSEKVLGFSDTQTAFRECFPNRKFGQQCLAEDLLGATYNAHNGLNDVRVLQQLVSKFLSDEILWRHSFTLSWFKEYTSFLKQKAENLKTFQPLIDSKTISEGIAGKAAASGLVFGHMTYAFRNNGVDGLRDLLTQKFYGKPRVTRHKRILTQISNFFLENM